MSARTEDQVIEVNITEDTVYLMLADGRVIGNPLSWHPWLAQATDAQRRNVELYELTAFWPDLDEGLDVTEMMKGEPPRIAAAPAEGQA
ncbi:MAG: DUF2442 domain-containing protein [Anaerolineae bacterium]|nr:DUF2442 domain-containing protein [Anaerolineae bacterium]